MENIDIVIPWVDPSDPAWRAEKENYDPHFDPSASGEVRYRDMDNLQYVFRSIEKYMPWVHKIFLVTWGHLPKWINTSAEKLVIVNHKDYIPDKYLPTFSCTVIEMNYHRIEGLSEHYIHFNDDIFVVKPTKPEDFFVNGVPKDMAVISPAPSFRDVMCAVESNNFGIINDYFTVDDISKNWKKWYSLKYGKFLIRTMIFSRFHTIIGIFEPHVAFPHLKSTLEMLWEKEYEVLDTTSKSKFRSRDDVNDWLIRHWQIMSGNFVPRRWDFGKYLYLSDTKAIEKTMKHPGRCHIVCVNDSANIEDFDLYKSFLNKTLAELFPEKSSFEK